MAKNLITSEFLPFLISSRMVEANTGQLFSIFVLTSDKKSLQLGVLPLLPAQNHFEAENKSNKLVYNDKNETQFSYQKFGSSNMAKTRVSRKISIQIYWRLFFLARTQQLSSIIKHNYGVL